LDGPALLLAISVWVDLLVAARGLIFLSSLRQWHLSAFGPMGVLSQRVNQMLRVPNLDCDARWIHGVLS
jgi:hypothetical protein